MSGETVPNLRVVACPGHGHRVVDLHGQDPMCGECRIVGPDGKPLGWRDGQPELADIADAANDWPLGVEPAIQLAQEDVDARAGGWRTTRRLLVELDRRGREIEALAANNARLRALCDKAALAAANRALSASRGSERGPS